MPFAPSSPGAVGPCKRHRPDYGITSIGPPGAGPPPRVAHGASGNRKHEYRLQLLNGEVIASYLGEKMKTIVVGHSDIEAGLTEALLLLHPGDCAKVLIPSYLGYGFSGDGIRVPSGASLLYDLHIVDVQRHAERKIL